MTIDHYALLKSGEKHSIISALLDWYDPSTLEEGDLTFILDEDELWDMTVDELKQSHYYKAMIKSFEEETSDEERAELRESLDNFLGGLV